MTTKRVVETAEFGKMVARMIRALARRVAGVQGQAPDVESLAVLVAMRKDVNDAVGAAVVGLRAAGHSWADIAQVLGTSRQAAQQTYGNHYVKQYLAARGMTTIRSLAAEHNMQPYELAAFLGLGRGYDETAALTAEAEQEARAALSS